MRPAGWLLLALTACNGRDDTDTSGDTDAGDTDPVETDEPADTDVVASKPLTVTVTVDGVPAEGATVVQAGIGTEYVTGPDGTVTIEAFLAFQENWIVASHPECRQGGEYVPDDEDALLVELERYDADDNDAYHFQDPGDPSNGDTTAQCAHCHVTMTEDWYASPHRQSASNAHVQDVYAGAAAAYTDQLACEAQGGTWRSGIGPGTGLAADRCYLGDGVLPALNPDCAGSGCDGVASETGACADCHAPGIDGELGGRDLLEATGFAYQYGVHCDVCHRVDRVETGAGPGVSGALILHRPSEESPNPGLGEFLPLTFGPWHDVAHVRMGSVQRDHFHDGTLCSGCHLYDQPVLVPGAEADLSRWPDGRLPVHSTWEEWQQGPMSPEVVCNSCHMPPDPIAGNGADLGNVFGNDPGVAAGWFRPPGSVKQHAWVGPRQPDSGMLGMAAALFVEEGVEGEELVATVVTKNVGAGHAIPTGEPLRSLVLRVEASCEGVPLDPIGGDAVPEWGGSLASRASAEDWTTWPGAAAGDVIRVVRRTGAWHDYEGFGAFGDGRFDAAGKGLPAEEIAGQATVVAVSGDVVTLDRALPAGDVAYLTRDGYDAGAPGFAFARVLADGSGRTMVPHYAAVDVVADNRLMPQQEWTSTHRFRTTCADPQVTARLIHRPFPTALVEERGWDRAEQVMVQVTK